MQYAEFQQPHCLPAGLVYLEILQFYLTPSGSSKSSIINPLSAIISPSFCNWFGNPDFHKMCIRDTTCIIVRTQNNVTYPAGLITINVLADYSHSMFGTAVTVVIMECSFRFQLHLNLQLYVDIASAHTFSHTTVVFSSCNNGCCFASQFRAAQFTTGT